MLQAYKMQNSLDEIEQWFNNLSFDKQEYIMSNLYDYFNIPTMEIDELYDNLSFLKIEIIILMPIEHLLCAQSFV